MEIECKKNFLIFFVSFTNTHALSNISLTESDVNIRLVNAENAIDRLNDHMEIWSIR